MLRWHCMENGCVGGIDYYNKIKTWAEYVNAQRLSLPLSHSRRHIQSKNINNNNKTVTCSCCCTTISIYTRIEMVTHHSFVCKFGIHTLSPCCLLVRKWADSAIVCCQSSVCIYTIRIHTGTGAGLAHAWIVDACSSVCVAVAGGASSVCMRERFALS